MILLKQSSKPARETRADRVIHLGIKISLFSCRLEDLKETNFSSECLLSEIGYLNNEPSLVLRVKAYIYKWRGD